MRNVILASLTVLIWSPVLAQESLCNPCVDPRNPAVREDLRSIERPRAVSPQDGFDLGATTADLRNLNLSVGRRTPVDEALRSAARNLLPPDMTDAELTAALGGGLWSPDLNAVAVAMPEGTEYRTYVFIRQGDGSYAATDASRVVAHAAFGYFGWPADEYERYETEPVGWRMTDSGSSLLYVQVRAWRQGQRYTVTGHYLVGADSSVSPP